MRPSEVKVGGDDGEISDWTRKVNLQEQDALYIPGQRIEIDYVLQNHRPKSFDGGAETKVVIEIRVEPSEISGAFERSSARELAKAVSMFYPTIISYACQLRELGNTRGVMDDEAHQLFVRFASEVEDLVRHKQHQDMDPVLSRWKEPVLAACKRILERKILWLQINIQNTKRWTHSLMS